MGLVLAVGAGMTQAFPLSNAFLGAIARPIEVSKISPAELESELDTLVGFMDDAFGPLAVSDESLVALAAGRLPAANELGTALALLCPSDLYLAMIGAESMALEVELLNAREE